MTEQPTVSVVIPVYNGEPYLAQAIDSVVTQTYPRLDVIVVWDPRSTDATEEIVKRYGSRVRCHAQTTQGAPAARNEGINLARGEFFSFLDADDLWVIDKLSRQVAAFNADATLDMVFGRVRQFHSSELDHDARTRWGYAAEIMSGETAGTMLITRDAFFRVGLFKTHWRMGEFIDWYSRAIELGLKSCLLEEVLLERRVHLHNLGIRERDGQKDYVHALKAMLDRRRTRPS